MKEIQKKFRLLLIVLMLAFTQAPLHASEVKHDVLASFGFKDAGNNGTLYADEGVYKGSATFEVKGGPYFEGTSSNGILSYWGWDKKNDDSQFWLLNLTTKGYHNLKLSSQQTSSGSGPKDFKVQTSLDGTNWTDLENGSLEMRKETLDHPNSSLMNVSLPTTLENQDMIYVRWLKIGNLSTNNEPVGPYGSNRFKGLIVSGDASEEITPVEPTRALDHVPVNNAQKVSQNAQIMIQFNNDITIGTDTITIQSDHGHTPSFNPVIEQNKLYLEHDDLNFGERYTVRIPKNAILSLDDNALVRDVEFSFTVQESTTVPKLLNMTFVDSPKSAMGFAWYTDDESATIVQLVESIHMDEDRFPTDNILEFEGTQEQIETFMVADDRSTHQKTKFYSHKVKADNLKPGTHYRFRLGNGTEWSKIGSFTTDTESNTPYNFIVGADSQASSLENFKPWADTFRKAKDHVEEPKFLILAGDLVDNGDLETHWQYMLSVAEDSLLHVPFVPVLGGHEVNDYDGDVTTENNNFYNHFNLEKNVVNGAHDGSVYSFEYGDALYMVFNSQYEGGLASNGKDILWEDAEFRAQVEWMKNTVARSNKKWKFVTFHKSPYAAGDNSAQWEDERVQFYRQHLIPVFDELAIDMVFEAHDHMYMRSYQMFGNEVVPFDSLEKDANGNYLNPKGTVYLMPNAMGNKFYTKNNQHYVDENWNAIEIIGEDGKPIPYDDFFAAINEQPFKKMFTEVGISEQGLNVKSFTAATSDEGKSGTVGQGLFEYDRYGITRTDNAPSSVENLSIQQKGSSLTLSWTLPKDTTDVRGFRVFETNDKINTHWSTYIPIKTGTNSYSLELKNIDSSILYEFNVRAVGVRTNGSITQINSIKEGSSEEPPVAPTTLQGTSVSQYENKLTWISPTSLENVKTFRVYRNGDFVGQTESTSFFDSGLQENTNYTYTITALGHNELESLHSSKLDVKTLKSEAGKTFSNPMTYFQGSIKPSHITQKTMDETLMKYYKEWKDHYLKEDPNNAKLKYVWYSDGNPEDYEDNEITVSEAHGYGMMISALMAQHDANAQDDFDSMYRYFRAHPSEINSSLMAWQQGLIDGSIVDINGADSATDGDMDIAYALIIAHEQWGSNGKINYLEAAREVIDAIMESDVDHTYWTLNLADWANSGKYLGSTRPSDWMIQHLKEFRIVSGDARWDQVIDATYKLSNDIYTQYSPKTGLLPDFVVLENGVHIPAPSGFLESENDGNYYYNSARTPWRLGTDYLLSGDSRIKEQLTTLNSWIKSATNNDVTMIKSGFALDGTVVGDWQDLTFTAPFMVSAMIDASNQQWLNDLWDLNTSTSTADEVYFGNNIRLLSLIVTSGNWNAPAQRDTIAPSEPVVDEAYALSDNAIMLKWLASTDNFALKTYHIYRDGKAIAQTHNLNFIDTQLKSNTSYNYWVVAEDSQHNLSKASNTRIVTTLAKGDKNEALDTLISLIEAADTKIESHYTPASWGPFAIARSEAHDYLNAQGQMRMAKVSETSIEIITENLEVAMKGLALKKNTSKPIIDEVNGKLPSTGIGSSTGILFSILLTVSGFVFLYINKKRHNS